MSAIGKHSGRLIPLQISGHDRSHNENILDGLMALESKRPLTVQAVFRNGVPTPLTSTAGLWIVGSWSTDLKNIGI